MRRSSIVGSLILLAACGGDVRIEPEHDSGDDRRDSGPADPADAAAPEDASPPDQDGARPPEDEDAAPAEDAGPSTYERCRGACRELTRVLSESCEAPEPADARRRFDRNAIAVETLGNPRRLAAAIRRIGPDGVFVSRASRIVLVERVTEPIRALIEQSPDVHRRLPVLRNRAGQSMIATGEIVVRLRPGFSMPDLAARRGLAVARHLTARDTWVLDGIDPFLAITVAADVAQERAVAWAEPAFVRRYDRRAPPGDPLSRRQWHLMDVALEGASPLAHVRAADAWRISEGDAASIVGVFDDGVDTGHPDLAAAVIPGVNDPADIDVAREEGCCFHGTSVAGIAAARANDVGLRGVCPQCSIMPIAASFELAEDTATAEAFVAACRGGAAVINNSWGPPDGDPGVLDDALEPDSLPSVISDAFETCEREGRGGLGTVIVFAAGNGNEPASADPFVMHPLTVGVAATDYLARKAGYSDFGAGIDVTAPSSDSAMWAPGTWTTAARGLGDDGVAPDGSDYTGQFGGTSSAAPVVSGLAALLVAINPALTAAEVRDILVTTAARIDPLGGRYDEHGWSPYYGHGRVDALRAARAAELAAGHCTPLSSPDSCNGIDDDCDGDIDEDCSVRAACEPCSDASQCGNGACARTTGDAEPRCLAACDDSGACDADGECRAGLCVPRSGRCGSPSEERCNGIDDDADGRIDEDVCATAFGSCDTDEQCNLGETCAGGRCRPRCETDGDCASEVCRASVDRFGDAGTVHVCAENELSFCVTVICGELPLGETRDFVECVESGLHDSCDAAFSCIPESVL